MFRLIAQLLVVSFLTLNLAWADDECALTLFDDSSVSVQIEDKSPPNLSVNNFGCDNWCHTWANPVDLPGTIKHDGYTSLVTTITSFYTLSYCSLPLSPPFHPPIA